MKTHSDDPDVAAAAQQAEEQLKTTLNALPNATEYDYGGHHLKLADYQTCPECTRAIAEAQAGTAAIDELAAKTEDETIREHFEVAAELMEAEAKVAQLRAMLHGGHSSEGILNVLLGFIHDRQIHDRYGHSHQNGGEGND